MRHAVVSIVVPAFNSRAWIAETIGSVLRQTYPAECLQLLVIDDGSTDGTADEARAALVGGRVASSVLSQPNSGPSAARNRGWRLAEGEWIQFLDADDLLHPDKLSIQVRQASGAGEDVAVVYSDWQRLYESEGEWIPGLPLWSPHVGPDAVLDLLRTENFIATGSQLFRRAWLERVGGFDERYRLIEDVHLLLRIAMAGGQFDRVPSDGSLFLYRHRPASLSRQARSAFVEGCVRNARMVEEFWEAAGPLAPARARALADVYFQGTRFFAETDPARFRELVSRLRRLRPGWLPPGPLPLWALARLIGYPRAEAVAVAYRRFRRWLTGRRVDGAKP